MLFGPIGSTPVGSSTAGVAAKTVLLVAAACTQHATSSTGAISVTPKVAGTLNLIGSSCTQRATSSTGAVSVTPRAAKTVNLVGASCTQSATSSSGAVTVTRAGASITVPASRTAKFQAYSRLAVFNTGKPVTLVKGALDELYFVGDFTKDCNDGATTTLSVLPVPVGVTVLEGPTLQGSLGVVKLGALDAGGGAFTFRVTYVNGEQADHTIVLNVLDDQTWVFGKDPDDRRYYAFDMGTNASLGGSYLQSTQTPVVAGVSALPAVVQGNLAIVKIGGLDTRNNAVNSCTLPMTFANGEKIVRTIYFSGEDH